MFQVITGIVLDQGKREKVIALGALKVATGPKIPRIIHEEAKVVRAV